MTAAAGVRSGWPGIIRAYQDRITLPDGAKVVTLQEGGTPLLEAPHLSELSGCQVYLKVEGANPTGSFKDRGMTVAISHALAAGATAVICASTGNTSASAAAYAARAGMTCAVLVPRGKIALGKLAQAVAYGARILQIDGNFDDCLELARKTAAEYPVELVNSVNPVRLIGQQTAAWEICDALGRAPDVHLLPVGNAGNITAYWQGYSAYANDGVVAAAPRLFGFQAEGAAPLVRGEPVRDPDTIATAIRVGNPASWAGAIAARDASGGLIDMLSDERLLEAYHLLAGREGVFVEPASAISVAGLLMTAGDGRLPAGSTVVCTVTGHGLKDPDTALANMVPVEPVPVSPGAVASALELG
ncbi:threonine synthase [Actinophytocola xanthii]|uniref:Threonine synthase n=1 Tax=Actinophytocola xanthii TaxID=1912961 RepID=A0A1Q8CWH2_9PSEU|nr:threonine synthase [Actinophytocola xanthii]OLF18696.1 threonine synthase [Actinophytocola xanthii]